MKPIICIIASVMLLFPQPKAHALFGHVDAERDRRMEAEQHLNEQQQSNEHLHIVISVLSAGVVISLIIGAAVGSKTRRDHET